MLYTMGGQNYTQIGTTDENAPPPLCSKNEAFFRKNASISLQRGVIPLVVVTKQSELQQQFEINWAGTPGTHVHLPTWLQQNRAQLLCVYAQLWRSIGSSKY
jgi:hypothetical protein